MCRFVQRRCAVHTPCSFLLLNRNATTGGWEVNYRGWKVRGTMSHKPQWFINENDKIDWFHTSSFSSVQQPLHLLWSVCAYVCVWWGKVHPKSLIFRSVSPWVLSLWYFPVCLSAGMCLLCDIAEWLCFHMQHRVVVSHYVLHHIVVLSMFLCRSLI